MSVHLLDNELKLMYNRAPKGWIDSQPPAPAKTTSLRSIASCETGKDGYMLPYTRTIGRPESSWLSNPPQFFFRMFLSIFE